jgi:hypothetical protein
VGEFSSVDVELPVLSLAGLLFLLLALAFRFYRVISARPGPMLVALGAVSGAAMAALVQLDPPGLRLDVDPSTGPLLPRGDPAQVRHEQATLLFGDDQVYVVALGCDSVFAPACLRELEEVAAEIARLDGVREVTTLHSATSFDYVQEEDWIEVRPFIDKVPASAGALEALKRRALSDPVYRRTLVSSDARVAAIDVRLQEMTDAELIASDLDGRIEAIVASRRSEAVSFWVSGRPHFKTIVYRGMTRDLSLLIPLAVVAIGLVLVVFHGSVRGAALPLANGLLGVLWTFGVMAQLGRPLSLLTVLIGPTLLAVGSVYALHVVSRYEEESRQAAAAQDAVRKTLAAVRAPLLIAALTTALGFGALLVSDVPAVRELGVFAVFGTGAIALLALVGVPAALAWMPLPRAPLGFSVGASAALAAVLVAASRAVARHTAGVLVVFAAAAAVAATALGSIEVDTDYLSYFDSDAPVRSDFNAINGALSGAIPLYVTVDTGEPGALREPAMLRSLEALERRIERVEGVGRALSFLAPLRLLNRAFHEGDPREERIPETRGEIAELLFMIPKTDLGRYASLDHATANLVARTGAVGSAAVRRVVRDVEAAVAQTSFPRKVDVSVTGNALLLARSADGVAHAQPLSVALAAFGILVFVSFGLRSWRLGGLAMLPNVLPVLLFFGLLGLGAAPLSLPTSLIGCIALGIAIDDTVHLLVRYREERRTGATPEGAVTICMQSVGRPVAITSLMLSAAFLTIALSEFATLREFGVLTAATMGLCLLTDLVFLPALLLRTRI